MTMMMNMTMTMVIIMLLQISMLGTLSSFRRLAVGTTWMWLEMRAYAPKSVTMLIQQHVMAINLLILRRRPHSASTPPSA